MDGEHIPAAGVAADPRPSPTNTAKALTMPKLNQLNNTHTLALALRKPEAAAALGIGVRKLEELTLSRKVPHRKIGRTIVYPVEQLKAWLEKEMEGVSTDAPA